MSMTVEERLKRRKFDALKRGVHRVTGAETLPIGTHIVGIGKAGAGVILATLRQLESGAPKLMALAVDIGDGDLAELRAFAATIPPSQAEVVTVSLEAPAAQALKDGIRRYPDFLTLEYPMHQHANLSSTWLPPKVDVVQPSGHFRRAIAKAIYGLAYYDGDRPMERTLRRFAAGVDDARAQSMVAIVFGMGGGTGSGIALDLARHLSNRLFGRRILVTGIGIAPCNGDLPEHQGAALFPLLNELDCLADEAKNQGVVASCGELFRNPFTAGFIVVPQQAAWEGSASLIETNRRSSQQVASLLTRRAGANAWELLRLLNWVAAPSTQHSAARTPWGARWLHMLGSTDALTPIGPALRAQLGLLTTYTPEFIEMRVADPEAASETAAALATALSPEVPPHIVGGGEPGTVQFILPCVGKTDLALFFHARDAYGDLPLVDRILDHALLLDQGVLLSERSTQLQDMAGASLEGGEAWIAVPYADLCGDVPAASSAWAA